jgi:hypothetical protein
MDAVQRLNVDRSRYFDDLTHIQALAQEIVWSPREIYKDTLETFRISST